MKLCLSCHMVYDTPGRLYCEPCGLRREADKRQAWSKFKKVRASIVRPGECATCRASFSKVPAHAHHPDYSRPYTVIWLCPGCHNRLHRDEILAVRGIWPK